jgi:DNA-binding NarL/FixJ family response regulator
LAIVDAPVTHRGRVVVADDDVLLREGLSSLLERSGFQVVGQSGDAVQLLELVRDLQPELVIVDIRMPPSHSTEGLDAAHTIREEFPDIGVLVLSAHVELGEATELLLIGQRVGYLLKGRVLDVEEFLDALDRILGGGSVVDSRLVHDLMAARRVENPLDVLTGRERDVLELMAEGRSNAGIAGKMWLSEATVEKHVRHILAKLKLPPTKDDHRRVLAVLTFLKST